MRGTRGDKEKCILQVEFEVELPRATTRSKGTIIVRKGETKLDDLEQVHIATEGLVMIVCCAAE